MSMTKKQNLPESLGILNDDEILQNCLDWVLEYDDLAEILKKLMCSELNSKEMLFAAFWIGKMQKSSSEEISDLITYLKIKSIVDKKEKK